MAIRFREIKLDGGWLMVKPEREDMGAAMHLVRSHKNRVYDLEVKEHREKRSLDANAYCWVLIGKLANEMRIKPVEVYREQIRNLGGNTTPVCIQNKQVDRFIDSWQHNGIGWICETLGPSNVPGCTNLLAYHGSSTYDTATMSRFIDNIVQDCKALGIETLPPEKLDLLKEEWH